MEVPETQFNHDLHPFPRRPLPRMGLLLRLRMGRLDEPPTSDLGAHISDPRHRPHCRSLRRQKRSSTTKARCPRGPAEPVDENSRQRQWQDSRRGAVEVLRHEPVPGPREEVRCHLAAEGGTEGSLR